MGPHKVMEGEDAYLLGYSYTVVVASGPALGVVAVGGGGDAAIEEGGGFELGSNISGIASLSNRSRSLSTGNETSGGRVLGELREDLHHITCMQSVPQTCAVLSCSTWDSNIARTAIVVVAAAGVGTKGPEGPVLARKLLTSPWKAATDRSMCLRRNSTFV